MIILREIDFSYDKKNYIFKNFNAQFRPREASIILGPNGVGKTTLLKLIAGILNPLRGEIRIFDKKPHEIRGRIGYIPQLNGLFPWMRIIENIELPLRIRREDLSKHRRIIDEIVERLGIRDLLNKYPKQLSGGEIQKVQIARELVAGSEILLLDEPLSMIDIDYRREIIKLLNDLVDNQRLTMLVVTHSIEDAKEINGKLYIMRKRPVELVEISDKNNLSRDLVVKYYRGEN